MARQQQRRVLVDRLALVPVVDPDRAGVDHAPNVVGARGLEHVGRAARVDALSERGVGGDLADVSHSGQMRDRVAALGRVGDGLRVGQIADEGVELLRAVVLRRNQVEDARLVARGNHRIDDVGADEAGASGDQDLHADSASSCSRSPA